MFMVGFHLHPKAVDWVTNVALAAGAQPSDKSVHVSSEFCVSCDNSGTFTTANFHNCNLIAPDSLEAARVPLLRTHGNNEATNNGFVLADLSVNGLQGDGTKYLDTGVSPSAISVSNIYNWFLAIYSFSARNETIGIFSAREGANTTLNLFVSFGATGGPTGENYWDSCNESTGRVFSSNPAWSGYSAGGRVGTGTACFKANSSTGHVTLASKTGSGGTVPTATVLVFTTPTDPNQSTSRVSFYAIANASGGAADSAKLYGYIQRARQEFGGGYI